MSDVVMSTGFPAGAMVTLYDRRESADHVPGIRLASGTTDADGELFVSGLEPGTYWAEAGGLPPVMVRAKEPGGRLPAAPKSAKAVEVDAEAVEGSPTPREVVQGARTSTNARPLPSPPMAAPQSLIDKAKAKLKGGES